MTPSAPAMPSLLSRGLKLTHLRLVSALDQFGAMQAAANHLNISQPAASRLAAEAERIIGKKIHERFGQGLRLTPTGEALALRAGRVLREIGDAERDISELDRGMVGNVRVGAVTGPAIEYVLPLLREARLTLPRISVAVDVGTSDLLGDMLVAGELDFYLGRLPAAHDADFFDQSPIATEPVSIIARTGHPLAQSGRVSAATLLDFDWVLPFEGAILRRTIEDALRSIGCAMPGNIYTTSSFLLTLALVRQSNAVAPLASAVARTFADAGDGTATLRILPTELQIDVETFYLIKPVARLFSPATQVIFDLTKRIAERAQASNAD